MKKKPPLSTITWHDCKPSLAHLKQVIQTDFISFIHETFHTINPDTRYLHNWHIDAIAAHLLACERGEIQRLIINMPPRALKSICVSVAWPAWLLGHNPARRIIAASYAQSLSLKHSLDSRLVMQSAWYQHVFPHMVLTDGQNEKHKFVTTQRGYRLATSVGGSVTGEGGNFLIIDDPHNPIHLFSDTRRNAAIQWFDQSFSSRLDDKKQGVIVLVMQRLHADDLTGYLLQKNSNWVHLNLPAIAEKRQIVRLSPSLPDRYHPVYHREIGSLLHPEREGEVELRRAKAELGGFAFQAQYQQAPIMITGGMIRRSWLCYYPDSFLAHTQNTTGRIIQSWDTAIKTAQHHDYSVCTTWLENHEGYYLLDVWRDKADYPTLKTSMLRYAQQWQPIAILIEDKASGQSLLQELRKETRLPLIAITPKHNKLTRMASVSVLFEAGKVHFPEHAVWLQDLETELCSFPQGLHDDQCDSVSQALQWLRGSSAIAPLRARML